MVDEATSELLAKERKKRDTAAAVAQMRERLRVMGVLQKTQQQRTPTAEDAADVALSEVSPSSYGSGNFAPDSLTSVKASSFTPKSQTADAEEDGYDTASTTSEPEEVHTSAVKGSHPGHLRQGSQDRANEIASEISRKSAKYKTILRYVYY